MSLISKMFELSLAIDWVKNCHEIFSIFVEIVFEIIPRRNKVVETFRSERVESVDEVSQSVDPTRRLNANVNMGASPRHNAGEVKQPRAGTPARFSASRAGRLKTPFDRWTRWCEWANQLGLIGPCDPLAHAVVSLICVAT